MHWVISITKTELHIYISTVQHPSWGKTPANMILKMILHACNAWLLSLLFFYCYHGYCFLIFFKQLQLVFLDCLHTFSESMPHTLRTLHTKHTHTHTHNGKNPSIFLQNETLHSKQRYFFSEWYFVFKWHTQTIIWRHL